MSVVLGIDTASLRRRAAAFALHELERRRSLRSLDGDERRAVEELVRDLAAALARLLAEEARGSPPLAAALRELTRGDSGERDTPNEATTTLAAGGG